jgi:ubiquinone biosynthesis protein COQ9
LLWEYSDDIWVRCGDKSTDYNYYSKRTLFNAAYAAAELHLLTDQSTEKFATWEFLDRRLDDILTMGKNISQLKTVTGAALDGILSLTTMFSSPPRIQTTPN